MFTRLDGLSDDDVGAALADGWGLEAEQVEHAPVGFGSHHWHVTAGGRRWFATVDDLEAKRRDTTESVDDALRRLIAALGSARSLEASGLDFVVAPVPASTGSVVHRIDDRYAAALYHHVDGTPHPWGGYPTRRERLAVLDHLVALHGTPASACRDALVDDHVIPARDELLAGLAERDGRWITGPYGEHARLLLAEHADAVAGSLELYERLAADVARKSVRVVPTHGEPHRGNTIDAAGGPVLIDWDTFLLAPPERDLWSLADEDPAILLTYAERSGIEPDTDALTLYRLWWDLTEVSLNVAGFRSPHTESDDTRVAWDGLRRHVLDLVGPDRWWCSP